MGISAVAFKAKKTKKAAICAMALNTAIGKASS